MSLSFKKTGLIALVLSGMIVSVSAFAHFNDKEPRQSYRQSWFAMVGANFGPIYAMMEGDMPWDDAQMTMYADQLVQLAAMDVSRGFAPGTDKGTTRAKPEIWENQADFQQKMNDFRDAALALQTAAAAGDRDAVKTQIGATGMSCKACHDEYKSKDYLY